MNRESGTEFNPEFNMKGRTGNADMAIVVAQEIESGKILMVAFATREAINATLRTGNATFYSRSRNEIWEKGGTSGNTLKVEEVLVDCDQDAIIYKVRMAAGGACHTDKADKTPRESCFYREVANLEQLRGKDGDLSSQAKLSFVSGQE